MPKCSRVISLKITRAMNGVEQILANVARCYGMREVLHDRPLVNIEPCGKAAETAGRDNSLSHLPFLILPTGNVLFLIRRLLCQTKKVVRYSFDPACIQVQERRRLVALH